ncbi:hypothetical protein T265_04055 [Opisthorchis viverrini]|uniref:Tetraspanin n=1 Tax=Opisthorchis viverrini TaxID=6198 RepID=A0A074ZPG1_OPIVI|nr:hypothetical protein T265_04055 [Opisthorchis viverrini]KER29313.1 hypothetical protein T265_04055 [Opisthorchis viverrini]
MILPLLERPITLGIFFINGLFILFGVALIALGTFGIIDSANESELTGSALYTSGLYMLIFFGLIILFLAVGGNVAAEKENRCLLVTYCVVICITIFFLFISGTMVLAFKDSLGQGAKQLMVSSLRNQYGRYKIITDAWNATQSRLRCCGVEDLGWQVYNDSWWDVFVNTDIYERNTKLSRSSPFYKFVPASCCVTVIDGITGWSTNRYLDLHRCMTWQYGPPSFPSGPHNDAIYYAGCFNRLRDYVNQYGKAMGYCAGLGRHATSWIEVAKKNQTHKGRSNICKCYLLNILVTACGRTCESYKINSLLGFLTTSMPLNAFGINTLPAGVQKLFQSNEK